MSIKTLYMYDIINGIYNVSIAVTILTFVISLVCLIATFIVSQSNDTFSFKEPFEKRKKSVCSLIALTIVSLVILIAIPSEVTINAYFGFNDIKHR